MRLNFSRFNPCKMGLSSSALVELIHCIMQGGRHWKILLSVLSQSTHQSNVDAFNNAIRFLLLLRYAVRFHEILRKT